MAFIPALISGVAGIAGGLFGKPQTTTTNQNSNTNTSQQQSASSLPNYDPLQLQMRNYLLGQFYQQTNPNAINSLVSNYVGTGTNNINQNANSQQQNLSAYLGAQGLGYSPAAASAYESADAGRVGQINTLQNSAPQLAANLQQSRLTSFAGYLSGLPVGTSSTGSSSGSSSTNGTSTQTGPNNSLAAGLSAGASTLAGLYGQGAFSGSNSSPVATSSGAPGSYTSSIFGGTQPNGLPTGEGDTSYTNPYAQYGGGGN